jgi:hypothetical protein
MIAENRVSVEKLTERPNDLFKAWQRADAKALHGGRFPVLVVDGDDRERGKLFVVHEADLPRLPSNLGDLIEV